MLMLPMHHGMLLLHHAHAAPQTLNPKPSDMQEIEAKVLVEAMGRPNPYVLNIKPSNMQEDEAKVLVEAMVESNMLELLVHRLGSLDERNAEEDKAIFDTLAVFENMVELDPGVATQVQARHPSQTSVNCILQPARSSVPHSGLLNVNQPNMLQSVSATAEETAHYPLSSTIAWCISCLTVCSTTEGEAAIARCPWWLTPRIMCLQALASV